MRRRGTPAMVGRDGGLHDASGFVFAINVRRAQGDTTPFNPSWTPGGSRHIKSRWRCGRDSACLRKIRPMNAGYPSKLEPCCEGVFPPRVRVWRPFHGRHEDDHHRNFSRCFLYSSDEPHLALSPRTTGSAVRNQRTSTKIWPRESPLKRSDDYVALSPPDTGS